LAYDHGVRVGAVSFVCLTACGRLLFSDRLDVKPDAPIGSDGGDGPMMVVNPSCQNLPATCGASGNASCCGNAMVPGGTFFRSFDNVAGGNYTSMAYPATVSAFRLDTYEITVGRFRRFVEAGMGVQPTAPAVGAGAHAAIANTGWQASWNTFLTTDTTALRTGLASCSYSTWTDVAGANENLPLNCIDWYESFAFCIWDGGYLPTEAEWNFAAAGGTDQRAFPWSSPSQTTTIDCTQANYDPATGYCVNPPTGGLMPVGSTSPQGDGVWGHADLAGSLWEKTLDIYSGANYLYPSCTDCVDLSPIDARVVRGGAWNGDQNSARVGYRYYDPPYERYIEMGARCARAP
jgi:formylglycine-generating enzyme required for sulfatase activity